MEAVQRVQFMEIKNHAPNGNAEMRTSGCWNLWKNIAKQDKSFGHPEKFCSDIQKQIGNRQQLQH